VFLSFLPIFLAIFALQNLVNLIHFQSKYFSECNAADWDWCGSCCDQCCLQFPAREQTIGPLAFRVLQFEHFLPRIRALLSCPSIPICTYIPGIYVRVSPTVKFNASSQQLFAGWQTKGALGGQGSWLRCGGLVFDS